MLRKSIRVLEKFKSSQLLGFKNCLTTNQSQKIFFTAEVSLFLYVLLRPRRVSALFVITDSESGTLSEIEFWPGSLSSSAFC